MISAAESNKQPQTEIPNLRRRLGPTCCFHKTGKWYLTRINGSGGLTPFYPDTQKEFRHCTLKKHAIDLEVAEKATRLALAALPAW
ncbi:MAG: hypothetical protein U5R30_16255 [Deltaproteobacteria bacterium]|nr:hypothetical protein [Deltaproteobacteria bacterium]